MKEFIEYVVKQLVEHPEEVRVTREEEDGKLTFELEVSESDIGRVIGKKGSNARALRTLLQAASSLRGIRSTLIIKEDREGRDHTEGGESHTH